jgi:hypothetical protein
MAIESFTTCIRACLQANKHKTLDERETIFTGEWLLIDAWTSSTLCSLLHEALGSIAWENFLRLKVKTGKTPSRWKIPRITRRNSSYARENPVISARLPIWPTFTTLHILCFSRAHSAALSEDENKQQRVSCHPPLQLRWASRLNMFEIFSSLRSFHKRVNLARESWNGNWVIKDGSLLHSM